MVITEHDTVNNNAPLWQRDYLCVANFMSAHPCSRGQCIKMRCEMGLDELIPLLVHLVLERWQLPLWWQTHKLCQADCKQKSHQSHHTRTVHTKTLELRVNWGQCLHQHIRPLPDCDGSIPAPVGVVDYCVEGLIDPLPEHHSRSRSARLTSQVIIRSNEHRNYHKCIGYSKAKLSLVKCHHASSNRHVHGNLCRHAAYQDHLLSGIGMESWVKDVFCSPQFILCQPWRDYTLPARWQRSKHHLVTAINPILVID